jgi:hypothetical protein
MAQLHVVRRVAKYTNEYASVKVSASDASPTNEIGPE